VVAAAVVVVAAAALAVLAVDPVVAASGPYPIIQNPKADEARPRVN
jgi:hypothetical protein